jgi:hypothetical protein
MYVLVGPGAQLEAVRVQVEGSGQFLRGLITVEGEAASATLRQCIITGGRDDSSAHLALGLLVAEGGRAALQNCVVQKVTMTGVYVCDVGSSISATSTMVNMCAHYGFAAAGSGKLVAERCIAHSNAWSGFLSENKGVLEVRAGCRSEVNEGSGFFADSGQLVVGEGCYAGLNKNHGYYSWGSKGRLQAGAGCIAVHNGGSGFHAATTPSFRLGPRAQLGTMAEQATWPAMVGA